LERAQARSLTAATLENAVVVMRAAPSNYMLVGNAFLVGDPRLNDRVLYAIDRGPASAQLARLFPTRTLYQFVQRTEPGHPLLQPSYIVEPMRVRTGSTLTLRFDATNTGTEPFVVASLKIDGRTVATQTVDRVSHAGVSEHFDVALGTNTADLPPSRTGLLVVRVTHDETVQVDIAFGPDARPDRADIFERRYFVTLTGPDLAVQTPGLQYHRFNFGRVVWARQNVEMHLVERP
jgi:hypothetical protein